MPPKPTTILHLDDLKLFKEAVGHALMEQMHDLDYLVYESAIVAIKDIETMFLENLPLDLVITDYNHNGPTGDKFALSVRELDVKYNRKTPILMLTNMPDDHPAISAVIQNKVIDKYLQKSVEPSTLKKTVDELISRKH